MDTLSTVLSGTKGLTSTCVHQLVERGEIDLSAPVARYWPEFAQAGKEDISIGMVMSHRSGVIGPRQRLHWTQVVDWDLVCDRLAAAEPWWAPGTAQGYHMTTFGFILGEVFRRVTGGTVGQYLRTEIAEPLGAEIHIGLPRTEQHRCADRVAKPHIRDILADARLPSTPPRWPNTRRRAWPCRWASCLTTNSVRTTWNCGASWNSPAPTRRFGAGTGDVLQRFGAGEAAQPRADGSVRVSQGGLATDLVLGRRVADHGWGLGYMLNQRCVDGPNPRIFGHGGLGGSFGFVDLEHRIGYAYVMNQFDATKANADPRSVVMSDEIYATLGVEKG